VNVCLPLSTVSCIQRGAARRSKGGKGRTGNEKGEEGQDLLARPHASATLLRF